MGKRAFKSAADYAAIGVAPILIFVMISSLANFLMLILYKGQYGGRVSWTLLMYTMGAVAVARIAIEQSRNYSLGYLAALGLAAFVVMSGFISGNIIFCAVILALIAYLADRIVHDCTLIDDSVDASGKGLIDFGSEQLNQALQSEPTNPEPDDTDQSQPAKPEIKKAEGHQPGRTVMYLALAALPLFGIGQFLLRSDSATWSTAQRYLALYLFSSLSLLVTTSFLGLRRYLRQRNVDMPGDVTVAWLAGGLVTIGLVLGLAYLAPMPGRALASIEMPELLKSPNDLESSRYGWGNEGADKSNPDASTTEDKDTEGQEIHSTRSQDGAQAGNANDGNRKDGPAGQQSGGEKQGGGNSQNQSKSKQSGKQQGGEQSKQSKSNSGQQQSKSQQKGNSKKQQESSDQGKSDRSRNQSQSNKQQSNAERNGKQQSGSQQDQQPSQSQKQSKQSNSRNNRDSSNQDRSSPDNQSQDSKAKQQKGPNSQDQQRDSSERNADRRNEQSDSSKDSQRQSQDAQRDQQNREDRSGRDNDDSSQDSSQQNAEAPSDSGSSGSSGIMDSISSVFSALGGLIKLLIFVGLFGVVAYYVYLHRFALLEWWNQLWNRDDDSVPDVFSMTSDELAADPKRPFASFPNPVGNERDPRRVIVITFQAFEAWMREQGMNREQDETPSEFIRRVGGTIPNMSSHAAKVVEAYNRIVYGRGAATRQDMDHASEIWQYMRPT